MLTPPQLIQTSEAAYPPAALAQNIEGSVGLRLTISKSGEVVNAEVVEPAGHGFDEAAQAAAQKFRFKPATRGDTPVGARILYRYAFKVPGGSAPPPTAPTASTAPTTAPSAPPSLEPHAPQQVISPRASDAAAPTKTAPPGSPSPKAPTDEISPPSVEVTVRGQQSDTRRLRESADAVTVVDTHNAKQQSRDLGAVLGSVEGVAVRRSGGLGSLTRFSLNGLYDNQIRFFIDGVPLDIAGSPFGISSVPVNAIDRIEIYRGVLPVRFGADALGGAVNLVTQKLSDSNAYASYQRGSFGTHRAALSGRYHHEPSGVVVGANGWLDVARNDYDVHVEVADKTGRTSPATVRRFHDFYRSYGGSLKAGVLGKRWAKQLSLQLFGLTYEKEVQHDAVMTRPIGEATYGATSIGGTARYEQDIVPVLGFATVVSFARQTTRFVDVSESVYDWYGTRNGKHDREGELRREAHDATIWQDGAFGRIEFEGRIRPEHTVRVAVTGRFSGRTGLEKASTGQGGIDPLAGARNIFTIISGVEYELNAFDMRSPEVRGQRPKDPSVDDRLQNIFVVKQYGYHASAKDVLVNLSTQSIDGGGARYGVGDSLRVRLTPDLAVKASYELATRIPSVDELFGDSLYINPNVELSPETSHNVNVGIQLDVRRTPAGNFTASADGFLRDASGLISALPESTGVQYKNLAGARIYGVEGSLKWISPKNWATLEGNATWQDARNVSSEGQFSRYDGERIPNRPWLFANWSARLQWRGLLSADDGIAPFYLGRYVREFYRVWESFGDPDFKKTVPTQVSHTAGISYWSRSSARTSVTFEVDNLTDERLYDFFGVERPGRSASVKVTGEF